MKKILFAGLLIGTIFSLNAKSFNVRFCNVTPEVKDKDESTKIIFSGADIYYKVVRNGKVLKASKKNAAEGGDEFLFYKKEEKLGPGVQRNLDSPNQIAGVGLSGTKDSDEVYITKLIVKGLKISNGSQEEVVTTWDREKPVKMMHNDVFYIEPYGPELAVATKEPQSDLPATDEKTDAVAVQDTVIATDEAVVEETVVAQAVNTAVIDADNPNRVGTGYRLRLGCFYTATK